MTPQAPHFADEELCLLRAGTERERERGRRKGNV